MTRFLLCKQKLRITFTPDSPSVVCPQSKAVTARLLSVLVGLNPQGRDQTQEYQGIAGPLCLFPAWALSPQSWRYEQHPTTKTMFLSLLALFGWVLQALCQPYQEEPVHCLMGLCIPQAMDGKLCFRGCIQTGGDSLTSLQSSSGTEGEENCGGTLDFQNRYHSSLFCAHYLFQYLTVRFFPDAGILVYEG